MCHATSSLLVSIFSALHSEIDQKTKADVILDLDLLFLCISRDMCKKIAGSGLSYSHLRCVFERDGEDGLIILLTSKDKNKIRVSNREDLIQNIINHFRTLTLVNNA